jgi:hypothetical protein
LTKEENAIVIDDSSGISEIPPFPGKENQPPIARLVDEFVNSFYCIGQTSKVVLPHISNWLVEEFTKNKEKMEACFASIEDEGRPNTEYVGFVSAHDFADFYAAARELEQLKGNRAPEVITKSLFMQMFSELDAFTGKLLKIVYLKNDDLLKGISREISLADLLLHRDIDSVKRAMLDKEIDTFRRDSYVEQFANLERKFGLSLRKFKEWGEFVELSQRRNLFTHNGGVVSDQYLIVCDKEGFKFDKRPQIGDALKIDYKYFGRALRIISKVGVMLAYTLWRKVFPVEAKEFHDSLNDLIFTALTQQRWRFAHELGEFALSDAIKKDISEISLRIRVVNISIGLKFAQNDSEAKTLINSLDWTASYRDFKLATAVLAENYTEATKLMISIGKVGEIVDQTAYHTWPLFTKFRERPEFYETYHKIYGEPFFRRSQESQAPNEVATIAPIEIEQSTKPDQHEPMAKRPARKRANKKTTDSVSGKMEIAK